MKLVKIMEVTDLQGGFAFKSKDFVEEGIPLVRIGEINDCKIEFSNKTVFVGKEYLKSHSQYTILKNDILIALSGATTGKFGRYTLDEDVLLNQRVLRIRANKNIHCTYLYYAMSILKPTIENTAAGAAQPNISPSKIGEMEIPLPSIEIQKQIVEVLDVAQKLINNRKSQIKLLDDLIESIFYDMFGEPVKNDKGWEVKILKEITSKIGSGATPRGGESSYKEEGITLIRSMNVYDNKFIYKGLAFIDDEQASKLSNVEVYAGDILINITGASINRACIVPEIILPSRVNQHVSILRIIENINNVYLLHLLISKKIKEKLYSISTSGGATREAITKGDLENFEVPIPPIQLQNQFAEKVEEIEKQKSSLEQSLKLLEDNYNNLMQRAFKGELFN